MVMCIYQALNYIELQHFKNFKQTKQTNVVSPIPLKKTIPQVIPQCLLEIPTIPKWIG